jgi:hypothetical protein
MKWVANSPLERTSNAFHQKFLNILADFDTISISNLGMGYTMKIMASREPQRF